MYWSYNSGMGFGWLFMLLPVVVVVLIIVALVRWLGGSGGAHGTTTTRQTPLEILQERYARGEIQREEYEQKRGDLKADRG